MKLFKQEKVFAVLLIVAGIVLLTGSFGYLVSSNVYKRNSGTFHREISDDVGSLKMYFISSVNNHSLLASGDCILFEKRDSLGKYHYGLVDTGPNSKYVSGLDEKIKSFLISHMQGKADSVKSYNGTTGKVVDKYVLDFMIITHSDGDHIGNAAYLVDNFKFKNVYLKDINFEVNFNSDYLSTVFYGKLVSKILDQNSRGNEEFKTVIYGLDDFSKYSDSKEFCTLDKVSGTNKNKIDDATINAYAKTPAICRLLVYYSTSSQYSSDDNVSFWLSKMKSIEKGVDYIPFSEMTDRTIDFGGANIDLFNLVDNELLTTEYLTTEQYNRYKEECPFYPYWPDYYDKTGMSLHSDQKNENYTSNSKFYHYSNYYSKYDIYDEDAGKTPTYSNSILNDNVRSIGMLVSVGSKRAVLAGDLMNYVRYANDSSDASNYMKNNFAYCGYEDALASAIAKKINSNNIISTDPIYIDFVKLSHHGLWYSNTLDYLNKLRPKYTITPRNSKVSVVGDLSESLAEGEEITATVNNKKVYPYGTFKDTNGNVKGISYKYKFSNWYSVDDDSSMVVRIDEDGVSVYPESYNSISIKSKPNKIKYSVGDKIDATGLVLNAVSANSTSGVVESGYSVSPSSFDSPGTKTVTITFGNATTTYSVDVYDEAKIGTCSNLTYNGSSQILITGGTGVIYDNNTGIDAGSYTVTVRPADGYVFGDGSSSKTLQCSIKQKKSDLSLSSNSGSIYVNETLDFSISSSSEGDISVRSSDNSIALATVDNGKISVKGISAGIARIFVTQSETNNYFSTTVEYTITVESYDYSSAQIGTCTNAVYNGKEQTIINSGKGVIYDVSTGINAGDYNIMATTIDDYLFADGSNTKKTVCSIQKASPVMKLISTSDNLYVGSSIELNVNLSNNGSFSVSSSDSSIALVSKNNNTVIIKGIKVGSSQIKVVSDSDNNYKSVTEIYNVNVKESELIGIDIIQKPSKLEYYVGDDVNLDGLRIVAKYSDGNSSEIHEYDYSPKRFATEGKETIIINYMGKMATFEVTVKRVEYESISIKNIPRIINYYVGDKFSSEGLAISLNYNNGKIETIYTGFTTSIEDGTVFENAGEIEVVVSYKGLKTSYVINVEQLAADNIIIKTLPNKINYVVGEKFDSTGLVLTVIKSDLTKNDISTGFYLSIDEGTVFKESGTKIININYGEKTLNFEVYVKKVKEFKVKQDSYKTRFYVGDKFDSSNMILSVLYEDGTSEEISSGFSLDINDDYTFTSSGKQLLKVSYGDVSVDLEIQVLEKEIENPNTGKVLIDILAIIMLVGFGSYLYVNKKTTNM